MRKKALMLCLFLAMTAGSFSGTPTPGPESPDQTSSGLSCIYVVFSPNYAPCGTTQISAQANCNFSGTVTLEILGNPAYVNFPDGIISVTDGHFDFEVEVSEGAPSFVFVQTLVITTLSDPDNCVLEETCQPTTLVTSCSIPLNDNCENATEIEVTGDECELQDFSNYLWHPSGMGSNCETNENNDVFFSFMATETEMIVEIGYLPSETLHLEVFSSCFGGEIYCEYIEAFQQIELNGLEQGNTYYLRFSDFPEAEEGDFSLCVREPFTCALTAEAVVLQQESCLGACDGQATVIPSQGKAPYSFHWDNGNPGASVGGLCPGEHTVSLTDANGCTANASVIIEPGIVLTASAGADTGVCHGDSIQLQASGGQIYRWSPLTGLSNPYIANPVVRPDTTISYMVSVTDSIGCKASDTIMLTIFPVPDSETLVSHESGNGFENGSALILPQGGTPPFSFSWSTGDTTQLVAGLAPGRYDYILTDTHSCWVRDTITIDSFICPQISMLAESHQVSCHGHCDGSIELFGAPQFQGPLIISWSDSLGGNPVLNLCPGTFSVIIIDSLNCSVTDTFLITEPNEILVVLDSITHVIADSTGAIAISTNGDYRYQWTGGDGFYSESQDLTGLVTGCYTLVVTDTLTQCTLDTLFCVETVTRTAGASPKASDWYLFPNPVRDKLQFRLPGYLPTGKIRVQLLTGVGQIALDQWVPASDMEKPIDISGLPEGYYLLRLQTAEREYIKRFIRIK